jgi:hypothetical protein
MNFRELVRRPVFVAVAVVVLLVLAAFLGGCPETTETAQATTRTATQTTQVAAQTATDAAQTATDAAQTTVDRQSVQVGAQPVSPEARTVSGAVLSPSEQAVSVRSAAQSEAPTDAAPARSESSTQTPTR